MNQFSIPTPCSENWSEMTPTEKGAFCQKCALEVNDLSSLSLPEIHDFFKQYKQKVPCVRVTVEQHDLLNQPWEVLQVSQREHMLRAMFLSLLVVFGLTLFSCSSPLQAQEVNKLQQTVWAITHWKENRLKKNQKLQEMPEEEEAGWYMKGQPIRHSTEFEVTNAIEDTVEADSCFVVLMGPPVWHKDSLGVSITEPEEVPIEEENPRIELPEHFRAIASPNPTSDQSVLLIELPDNTDLMQIWLMGSGGQKIRTICHKPLSSGKYEFTIPMATLTPGIYMVAIMYNNKNEIVRIVKR